MPEKKIKELIIVEGKNDAHLLRRALGDIDIIWTEGLGLTQEKMDYIKGMAERKGIIICTDPDYPGLQIREKINRVIPDAKHVYIDRQTAYNPQKQDIGVENASIENIQKAFSIIQKESFQSTEDEKSLKYDLNDLREYGLVGEPGSALKRSEISRKLGLGDTNAKQFLHRLNRFGISRDALKEAVNEDKNKE